MYYPNFDFHYPLALPPVYSLELPVPHPHPPIDCKQHEPPAQYLRHNSNYWWPLGTLRFLIIISTLGGVISAWCVCYNATLFSVFPDATSTQAGCIVIFSIFFPLSLFIFLMSISNFVNLPGVDSFYYLIAVRIFFSEIF